MGAVYNSLVTAGSLVSITSCCFFLGILYSNWPYSYYLLWSSTLEGEQERVTKLILDHYLNWLEIPKYIPYTMYGVILFGFLGFAIKIFNPSEDVKYFEYGSFLVYVISVCCYISNVRFGVYSAQAREWGDVDEFTGLSVIAASEVIIVFLLLGIVVIQLGLFYARYEDDRVKTEFLIEELRTKLAEAEKSQSPTTKESSATSSGSSKGETAKSVGKTKKK